MTTALHEECPLRREGALGVHSLDHFRLAVPDLGEARDFFSAFGLDVRATGGGLDLHAEGEPHRWATLVEGSHKRLHSVCFGAFAEDLHALRARLVSLDIEWQGASSEDSIWLRDPAGNLIEIRAAGRAAPREKSLYSEWPAASALRGATSRSLAPKVRPRRLAHLALFTPDVSRTIAFYEAALGLRLSDRSADAVAFMHAPHGSEHHLIALVRSDGPGLHHSSWDTGSVQEIGLGAMQMADAGYRLGWGLGRHVLGSNYFHYVRDPWGSYAEYSAGMDYIPADVEWVGTDQPVHDSMYLWGPSVPEDFVTNYETAR
ncbi:VOC family protein [Paraburkholderia caffeinilytica]|uniref:VOC family protein n=1 Tax=Paraburkholderia caffeinilytica TaxID=1761016 RepID=UPI003DA00BEF